MSLPVQGICPNGWHVPSNDEWQELFDFVGGSSVAGDFLKTDSLWSGAFNDSYGFSALPSGRWSDSYDYIEIDTHGFIWTSSKNGATSYIAKIFQNQTSVINESQVTISDPVNLPWLKYSCRCVKD